MPKSPKDEAPNRALLDELVHGAQRASLLKAAIELDVFSRIAEGIDTLPALVRAGSWSERGTRIMLDALVHAGLLVKSLAQFELTPTSETYLVRTRPGYIGDALLIRLAWEPRGQLARAVRTGKPQQQVLSEPFETARAQRAASDAINAATALERWNTLWELLDLPKSAPGPRILSLAAGAALPVLALARRDPAAKVTLLDSPPVLEIVKRVVESLGLTGQVTLQDSDLLTSAWGRDSFELAWMGGKTQYLSFVQNIGVFRHAYEALVEGGRVVVDAPISDEERRGPGGIPLHGLDVLLSSAGGDIYTAQEYRGMLEATGFFQVVHVHDHPGLMTALRLKASPEVNATTQSEEVVPPPVTT